MGYLFLNCVAKLRTFFVLAKFFGNFFNKKLGKRP